MRFGNLNVRSLCRPGSLTTVPRELATFQFGLVGAQEVRWDKGGTNQQIIRAGPKVLRLIKYVILTSP
jgi:hypothetical protein